ncbi:hypothetical protein CPU12_01230 [Malaciobacter molluscorum LMG 25693]|uniref:Beta/gamma crystallin 'Greek key' domain-containing protein n=1 Tax=Malaciobacter molluscorum LMG 25693 TaxID=870501 RepID=A0A2G1DLT3_9BACT|nr:hypothetical protein [Malaciobacter molluscorum]AXX92202.1 hypothetical protein AMOL_1221 [Malaciobacter molluscorum LMG 25693]PHO19430.1 hypothetical protein CPU12_01230 [Malaciobacter molluscorum LMG 25693]
MKTKLLIFISFFVISLYAANSNENDLLNVRIDENVILKNGYGALSGKPILKEKNIEEKINLRGEFNVDEKNNASFEFNKLEYNGKIYNLNNAFIKKGRLKQKNITLKKDSNLTVEGGNLDEILSIINAADEKDLKDKTVKDSTDNSYSQNTTSGGYDNSSQGFTPSYLDDNNSDNNDNSKDTIDTNTKDNNSAVVVTCPEASYDGKIATYYIQLGTVCTKRTSLSVKTVYNSDSCQNKVDYKNNKISLGYELFASDPEGGDFLVQRCKYKEPIPLVSKVDNCDAIPNYQTGKAEIQKQYSYIYEKEEHKVGECTPSGEFVNLDYDINKCDAERHDFENNVSIEQGKYFYFYENEKTYVGECVDIPKYTYKQYLDDTTCDYEENDGRVLYLQRVAYDDLNGIKRFATECEVTNSGGLEIFNEFAGYEYQDSSKQALRKINQYFIIPGTTTKKYIKKDIVTDKAYPYIEESCGVDHDDQKLQSTYKTTVYFNDNDENKKIVVQPCQVKQVIPYTLVNGSSIITLNKSLGFKRLEQNSQGFNIYGEPTKTIDLTTGIFPIKKGNKEDISAYPYAIYNASPFDKIRSGLYVSDEPYYIYTCNKPIKIPYGTKKSCIGGVQTTSKKAYRISVASGDYGSCSNTDYNATITTCNYYDYFEKVGEYSSKRDYLRGDGSVFRRDNGLIYRIIR